MRLAPACLLASAALALAASDTAKAPAGAQDEIERLKAQVRAQQEEIEELRQRLDAQQKLLEGLLPPAQALAAPPASSQAAFFSTIPGAGLAGLGSCQSAAVI